MKSSIPYRPKATIRSAWFGIFCGLTATIPIVSNAEEITVNVSSYVRKTPSEPSGTKFKGLGINLAGFDNENWYARTSQTVRDSFVKIFWKDLDLRGMRVWAVGVDAKGVMDLYQTYIQDVKKQQPNPLIYTFIGDLQMGGGTAATSFSREMTDSIIRSRVVAHAKVIKDLDSIYGWKMNYVEMANEPDTWGTGGWYNPHLWGKALSMIHIWRQELDSRGLQYVKILAPSRSMVVLDEAATIIDSLKLDTTMQTDWKGYSFHSYGMGMLRPLMDKLEGVDVDIIQTEGGSNLNVGHILADINLGVTLWHNFLGFGFDRNYCTTGPACEANPRMNNFVQCYLGAFIDPGTANTTLYPFARYYYFREIARLIPVGSRVHNCTTNLPRIEYAVTSQDRFINMEVTEGPIPPITATAAEQPDGRWGLLVLNASDTVSPWGTGGYTRPYPATTVRVTFKVPELASYGSQPFKLRKIKPNKDTLNLGTITMENGVIVVDSLKFGEMVSLQSTNALTPAEPTQPDLVVTEVAWTPQAPSAGDSVTFSATVKNRGTVATLATDIQAVTFYIDGETITWSTTTGKTSSLEPGASIRLTANDGPGNRKLWAATTGKHTLVTKTDDVNRILESNETNNTRVDTIDVSGSVTRLTSDQMERKPFWTRTASGGLSLQNVKSGGMVQLFRIDGTQIQGQPNHEGKWLFSATGTGILIMNLHQQNASAQYVIPQVN